MKNNKCFTFDVDPIFSTGIKRLSDVLGFSFAEGIHVTAKQSDRSGIELHNGQATIYYIKKHHFFRQMGVLAEHATEGNFEYYDDTYFEEVSMMWDVSFGGVPLVETAKKTFDRLALMGYNSVLLYAEDIIGLESRPYLGYMRGRYSADELRELDDYAWEYGIELIPCLECYGHMQQYLRWDEAAPIKDTPTVLLAREEETFIFLEELLTHCKACFRTNRVHIGMDEAWDMGRGTFLNKYGYVPPYQIFSEYMERLISITKKLGLVPMMWSDMYFRISSGSDAYYDERTEIPREIADNIPEGVELVFWHYGEEPRCDDYMLKKHKALGREVVFAGGLWDWCGHFPEHNYMMETLSYSLKACRNNDVHRAMVTCWIYIGTIPSVDLFGLSYFAELCYDPNISKEKQAARFAATCDGDWEAFYTMSLYHNYFDNEKFDSFNDRFFGKPLFYQDLMEGLFDLRLWERPMSKHYTACAEKMNAYTEGKWNYLYRFASQIFEYLALKTKIHETLVPAYKAGDMETLQAIAGEQIPALKQMICSIHNMHRTIWHENYKPFSWRQMEDCYAGMASRCDTAKMLVDEYISGKTTCLLQLEEPRLYHRLNPFFTLQQLVM